MLPGCSLEPIASLILKFALVALRVSVWVCVRMLWLLVHKYKHLVVNTVMLHLRSTICAQLCGVCFISTVYALFYYVLSLPIWMEK